MIIIVKQIGADSYALRSIPRSAAVSSPRKCTPAGCSPCRAASTSSVLLQPRDAGASPAGLGVQADRLCDRARERHDPASIVVDAPFCVWQGAGLGNKCFRNFDAQYAGPKTMRWGVEQSRNLMTVRTASQTGMPKVIATAQARRRQLPQLSVDRARRRRDDVSEAGQRLCDARQPGPRSPADDHRLCPGPQRQGHLSAPTTAAR
jgi:hypothetical protein